jgi:gluconolactonase
MKAAAIAAVLSLPLIAQPPAGIRGVIAAGAQPELVQEGFVFTEGPVGTADGGLFFSDIRANKIYHLDPSGKITTVRENTNSANGLAFNKSGELYAAEGDGKRISRGNQTGNATPVVEGIDGKPFAAPNDLIFDSRGGFYFTDPGPRPVEAGRHGTVYYVSPGAKQPVVVNNDITRPNGLTLTRDGKTLIVDDTIGDTVFAFDVQPDGMLRGKRPFAKIHDVKPGEESGADGLALDRDGRIYITTGTGVQVFDRKGAYLGTIKVPRQPANCAFSGPGKRTLYITAREGLYRVQMLSRGPDRLGK